MVKTDKDVRLKTRGRERRGRVNVKADQHVTSFNHSKQNRSYDDDSAVQWILQFIKTTTHNKFSISVTLFKCLIN